MSENRTFFKDAKAGEMSLGAIFSEVTKRHTAEETAQVLTAGTVLTTPADSEILAGWQKPFLFARFFVGYLAFLLLAFVMGSILQYNGGYYLLMVGIPFLVPVTLLLLVWEMNVPRNISLYEVISITAIGGVLSIIATVIANFYSGSYAAVWAGIIEEPAKLIIIYIILNKKNYKYALNGALIGAAVGTGFAVMESLMYVISGVGESMFNILVSGLQQGYTLVDVLEIYSAVWGAAVIDGIYVAIARAVTAISGHGIFAALYGSALVKAKGSEEIRITHLFKPEFLTYFAISILLHALHNSSPSFGLPVLLNGLLRSEYIIIAAIAVGLLVNALRVGVNQAISIAVAQHGGSVTEAVTPSRKAAPAKQERREGPVAAAIKLQCISGPHAGEKYRCREGQSFTIGREEGKNSICVSKCKYVGGVHCRIEILNGRVFVTDMTSRNGTYLDNQRLTPNQAMPALNGSVIKLADDECVFQVVVQ